MASIAKGPYDEKEKGIYNYSCLDLVINQINFLLISYELVITVFTHNSSLKYKTLFKRQ
ncbi:hypothetical protein [Flavitalea sp.]|nr:hypothetical protein [Flavitalea sp.]